MGSKPDSSKKADAAAAAAAEAARPKAFQPGQRESLIKDLRSTDANRVKAAAKQLAKTIPDDKPADVCRAMKSSDSWGQADLLAAIEVWFTPDAEAALIEASRSDAFFVRGKAISLLGKCKTETAAEAAAAQMIHDRGAAESALKAMGPVAEPYTIPILKDRDFWIRASAYAVLGEVGGKKSLRALKAEMKNLDGHSQGAFNAAIAAIEKRLGPTADEPEPAVDEKPSPAAGQVRTWRDASGAFEVQATMVSSTADKVTLKKADGRMITIPLEKLSEADRTYVQQHPAPKLVNPFE